MRAFCMCAAPVAYTHCASRVPRAATLIFALRTFHDCSCVLVQGTSGEEQPRKRRCTQETHARPQPRHCNDRRRQPRSSYDSDRSLPSDESDRPLPSDESDRPLPSDESDRSVHSRPEGLLSSRLSTAAVRRPPAPATLSDSSRGSASDEFPDLDVDFPDDDVDDDDDDDGDDGNDGGEGGEGGEGDGNSEGDDDDGDDDDDDDDEFDEEDEAEDPEEGEEEEEEVDDDVATLYSSDTRAWSSDSDHGSSSGDDDEALNFQEVCRVCIRVQKHCLLLTSNRLLNCLCAVQHVRMRAWLSSFC